MVLAPSKGFLTSKAGPLPVVAWFGLGLAGALGYAWYKQHKAAQLAAMAGAQAGTPGYTLPSNIQPQNTNIYNGGLYGDGGFQQPWGYGGFHGGAVLPGTPFNMPPGGGYLGSPSSYNTPPCPPGQLPPPGAPYQLGGWGGAQGGLRPPTSPGYGAPGQHGPGGPGGFGGGPPGGPGGPVPGPGGPGGPQPPGPGGPGGSFGSTPGGNGSQNRGQHNGGGGYAPGGQRANTYGGY
jgi:hypothetical protein